MTYEQALEYIHSTLKFGIRPGLERIGTLLRLMGNPQEGMKFIHVAGTNGKGSTCCAIAGALEAAGYKTGLYTSPYLEDFCERMQINRRNIPHEELAEITSAVRAHADEGARCGEQPTEFELCTAIAFEFFKRNGCDAVVLEVGLGGRFDATNIIGHPLVSVITAVSLDHTLVLGDTIEKIAFEKCGIIKQGGITVSSPQQEPEALAVIMECCARRGNTLVIPNAAGIRVLEEGITGSVIDYKGRRLRIPLAGRHQHRNFVTAWEAVEVLRMRCGFMIPDEAVEKGFAAVKFPARLEKLAEKPLVLLDGAHNPAGAAVLAQTVKRFLPEKKMIVIMGIFADKDYEKTIAQIAPLAERFFAVAPPGPRALEAENTARAASRWCKSTAVCSGLDEAFERALSAAGEEGAVLICGSLSLAGAMRTIIRQKFYFSFDKIFM
ncbi:MAG: bifunctional folylpolyglutamate synthase/dihydrofolate synthase [Clostridia bacterium]|nr:bifunctional folylpolyglutamate synthase/dihydrofolate synthase [Clostridia bacterium]